MHLQRKNNLRFLPFTLAITLFVTASCVPLAQVAGYAIAYRAFSFVLGETGAFLLKAAEVVRQAGIVALPFEATPTDEPASATLSLEPGTVQALPLPDSAQSRIQQGLNGSATIAVYIADAAATNPCETGTYVGAFEVTIAEGEVAIADTSLALPTEALAQAITGTFSICLEVTSTVDMQIIVEQLTVTFGPPVGETPPTEQPPSEEPPVEQPPTEQPPAEEPPIEQPPAEEPPSEEPPTEQPPSEEPPSEETPDNFQPAAITHWGTEELLVGPSENVDPTLAFYLEHPFNVGGFSLSGDGQKVWFWTWWDWSGEDRPTDWIRVYSMNIDGSDLQQTTIPLDDAQRGWDIATNDDGSVAIFELGVVLDPDSFWPRGGSRFFLCNPGQSATLMYDTIDNPPDGSGGRGLRLNDNATKFFWVDIANFWSVSLASAGTATQIATVEHLNFYGPWDPVTGGEFNSFDINDDGSTWLINVRFWDNDTQTARWELATGVGELPLTTQGIDLSREGQIAAPICLSDDGGAVAYTSLQGGSWCYVHGPGGTFDLTATGTAYTGGTTGVQLSDDGHIAWFTYVSDGSFDGTNYSSVRYDLDGQTRHLTGTGYYYGSIHSQQLSDDGSVLAAIFSCCRSSPLNHVFVMRDGVHDRPGFPTISNVLYRFDDQSDALIVRVTATGIEGLDSLYTRSHIDGIVPQGFLPEAQSPLYRENGSFLAVQDEPDTYERVIDLEGKGQLLDGSQSLRIVAADSSKTRVTYLDFAPVP